MSPDKATLDELRIHRRTEPQGRSRTWLVVIIVLLISGAAVAWGLRRSQSVSVRTAEVQETSVGGQKTLLNGSGYVTARRIATVSSKVSGKVMEVLTEEGKKVEAGQILSRLDPSNAEKGLELAQAQLRSARQALEEIQVKLDQAELDLNRIKRLAAENIATVADLDRTQSEARAQKARLAKQIADVEVAEKEVAVWKQQLDDTIIRAPFAGIVTSKNAQPGEIISPMSAGGFTRTGICTIVDMNSLEIEVDVSESYINRVEPGQTVEAKLDAY